MTARLVLERAELWHGDCLEVLRAMADESVDSIVTDPPYGLTSRRPGGRSEATRGAVMGGFMGLQWDCDVPGVDVWAECLRVLKPGGHLLAFAGTRTQHRMAVRIEDAGFEIRDMLAWVYGSGFPKSHNGEWGGTALKPALEPITFARKPLIGTVYQNWRAHGTGALNIDACRVESHDKPVPFGNPTQADGWRLNRRVNDWQPNETGRWPANLIHDGSDEVLAVFPQAAGQQGAVTGDEPSSKTGAVYGAFNGRPASVPRGDAGSAARFFYCAKASAADRDEGLGDLQKHAAGMASNTSGQHITRRDGFEVAPRANHHPTVKPTDLMRYLCRLITPPGGIVLDPFMGSGSTGKAAMLEGFRFVGCELSSDYLDIARARIAHAQQLADELARQPQQMGLEL